MMTHNERAGRRERALEMRAAGMKQADIARELDVHHVTVRMWTTATPKLEREIHRLLVRRVSALGGETRRVKWIGRANAPDVLVMLPGKHVWVEEKRPGEIARAGQLREHERMRAAGCHVLVIDSPELIDLYFPEVS